MKKLLFALFVVASQVLPAQNILVIHPPQNGEARCFFSGQVPVFVFVNGAIYCYTEGSEVLLRKVKCGDEVCLKFADGSRLCKSIPNQKKISKKMAKDIFDRRQLVEAATKGTYWNEESQTLFLDHTLGEKLPAAVKEYGEVRIHRFGTFKRVWVPERTYKHPKTKELITKPAHWKPKFVAYKKFKESVQ